MADVFVARQPIFNQQLEVVAYELLYRGSGETTSVIDDNDGATATVAINAFTEIGLDSLVGNHRAWLNVSRNFLLEDLARTLPARRFGLELLEDQEIDDSLIATIRDLRESGYVIALDDFRYKPPLRDLVSSADFVKLDILGLEPAEIEARVAELKDFDVTLVAEKVESQEEYALCAELGFDLFQGFFFCKPEVVSGRGLSPNRLSLLRVLAALQDPMIELDQLDKLISRDVALSYRLLRYINSAFFGLRREVSSVGRALSLLGLNNIQRWSTLTIFAGIDDKPAELVITALVRARFCELAGPKFGQTNKDQLFTLGLFSVVDALMDAPMKDVLSSVPFPEDMLAALISRSGDKGVLLDCVVGFERGDFHSVRGAQAVAGLYREALTWATEAAEELFSEPAATVAG